MISTTLRRLGALGAASAVLSLSMAMPAQAADGPNIVANGNFAAPAVTQSRALGPGELPGWTIATTAEIDPASIIVVPASSQPGTQSSDLNETGPSTISQVLPTEAGKVYKLQFNYAGNPGYDGLSQPTVKTAEVTVGSYVGQLSFDTTGRTHGAMGWTSSDHSWTATGPTTLTFSGTSAGNFGIVITNVAVTEVIPDGVPMADDDVALMAGGAAVVLVAGIGAVVLLRRRSTAIAA
ncbi:DUF642 domain-containing protein [Nocardioides alcanivorans]|uniref:DUF642 domain-containing protein n=1 Tax=Nocardioides alcanivorans TaxID=2897352 RepID=UPI001F15DB86|nr:DUF642 domain-containing protein [Nocardioides alcanivorans]